MTFARLHDAVAYLMATLGLLGLALGGELEGITLALVGVGLVVSLCVSYEIRLRPGWARRWTGLSLVALVVQGMRAVAGTPVLAVAVEFACFLQISRLMSRRDASDYAQIAVLALLHLVAATVLSPDVGYAFVFLGFVVVTPWMLALSHLRREIEANYPAPAPTERRASPVEAGSPQGLASVARLTAARRWLERWLTHGPWSGRAEPEAARVSQRVPGRADVRRVLASRRVVGGRFLLGTAALGLPIFASSISVFLLFPRVGVGVLPFGKSRTKRVAGFGDRVKLGGFGTLRDDPTIIARVSLPAGLPLPPAVGGQAVHAPARGGESATANRPAVIALRLRATAFDRYDGRTWSRAPGPRRPMMRFRSTYVLSRPPDRARDTPLRIAVDPLDEPVVFLPPGAVAVDVPTHARGGVPEPHSLQLTAGFDLRYEDRDPVGLVYDVWTSPDPADAVLDVPDAAALARLLEVPPGHERVAALAHRITKDTFSPLAKARAIQAYLTSGPSTEDGGGGYRYTLRQPEVPEGRWPLDVFLFEARAGHCEYFATAMAVMLRTVGVPARNVVGLLGGRYNAYGDYYALRQGDAHSWVEVWDGARWHTFDPTPPARDAPRPDAGALASLDALLDALRTRWNTRVVGYDLEQQMALIVAVGRALRAFGGGDTDGGPRRGVRPTGGAAASRAGGGLGRWAVGCALAAALAMALVVARKRGARGDTAPRGMSERTLSPAAAEARKIYADLERALARAGAPRPAHLTAREHARALARAGFAGADVVAEVTEAYLAARFGGAPLDGETARMLRRRIRQLAGRRTRRAVPGAPPT